MSDVFGDHGLAEPVVAHQGEVASLAHELKRQRAFDEFPVDLRRPVPFEVGREPEAADARGLEASLEAAASPLAVFDLADFFEQCLGRPASFYGAGEKIVRVFREGGQPDPAEGRCEVILRYRGWQGHCSLPGFEVQSTSGQGPGSAKTEREQSRVLELWSAKIRPRSLMAFGATHPPPFPAITDLWMRVAPASRMMLRVHFPGV